MSEQRIYIELQEETTASSILPHSIEVVSHLIQEIKRRYENQISFLDGDYSQIGNEAVKITTETPKSNNPLIIILIEGNLVRVIEHHPFPFMEIPIWGCWNIDEIDNYQQCFLALKKRLLIQQWGLKDTGLEDNQGFQDFIHTLENLSIAEMGEQSIDYALKGSDEYYEDFDYFMLAFPIVVNDKRTQKKVFSTTIDLQIMNTSANHASHEDICLCTFVRGRFFGNRKYYIANLNQFHSKLKKTLRQDNKLQEHINNALNSYTSNNMLPTLVNETKLIPDHEDFKYCLPEYFEYKKSLRSNG